MCDICMTRNLQLKHLFDCRKQSLDVLSKRGNNTLCIHAYLELPRVRRYVLFVFAFTS